MDWTGKSLTSPSASQGHFYIVFDGGLALLTGPSDPLIRLPVCTRPQICKKCWFPPHMQVLISLACTRLRDAFHAVAIELALKPSQHLDRLCLLLGMAMARLTTRTMGRFRTYASLA